MDKICKDAKTALDGLLFDGMTIMTGAGVESLKATASGVSASIKGKDGKLVSADYSHCIVAIGIVPNTENIGLEALGVTMDRGFLKTDPMCRTNVPGLWAIGDITAPPWLAHKASHEGVIAAEAIAGGHPHAMDPRNIPGCTYCHPQVASVGLTEAKAREAGYDVKVGNFPFIGNGKAIALGEPEGMVKTIFMHAFMDVHTFEVDRIKVGRTMEESLQEAADKLAIAEFNFFTITLAIQRETGGNLAETLSNLSDVLRKRAQMKLKINAMSSESKASAWISSRSCGSQTSRKPCACTLPRISCTSMRRPSVPTCNRPSTPTITSSPRSTRA